jgi:hypothetical protein
MRVNINNFAPVQRVICGMFNMIRNFSTLQDITKPTISQLPKHSAVVVIKVEYYVVKLILEPKAKTKSMRDQLTYNGILTTHKSLMFVLETTMHCF